MLRHQNPVYRLLLRVVRDPTLAEDLAQDTFVKAYRALRTYDPKRKFSSWVFKIAHNTAIDHLRRGRLATVPLEPATPDEAGPIDRLEDEGGVGPEQYVRGRDLARDLTAAVETLDLLYRELVLLRFQEGLAYQEIVDITGLPMGTVKTRLHRGRKQLAEALTEMGWSSETSRAETS